MGISGHQTFCQTIFFAIYKLWQIFVQIAMGITIAGVSWVFALKNNSCSFTAVPGPWKSNIILREKAYMYAAPT